MTSYENNLNKLSVTQRKESTECSNNCKPPQRVILSLDFGEGGNVDVGHHNERGDCKLYSQ